MIYFFSGHSQLWFLALLVILGRYILVCSILYGVFYVWKRRDWMFRKIQQRFPGTSDYRREAGYSFLTALIFASMVWLWRGTPLRELTQFYTDLHAYPLWYTAMSIPLAVLIHDTYFYWIHRLMHHPAVYRRLHLVHHRSVNPSPWAAYAFHPLEAVLEAGIIPVLLILIPMHPISVFAFATFMFLFNVYGHLGYELFPAWLYRHRLGRVLNSAVYHNQHHEYVHGNYGLYFNWWDKWMGTLREDNSNKLEEVLTRIQQAKHD